MAKKTVKPPTAQSETAQSETGVQATLEVRCAFRAEGGMINAYLAAGDTLAQAVLLGSLHRGLADNCKGLWQDWKEMMTAVAVMLCEDATGSKAMQIEERPAPQHERSSRA